ncbi:Cyst wall protein type 2 [Aduncisulcus paluster]|uniref:Cyst wall protein type 2 n=1 Tax=Aduncisulcus paluster TaxID=2918883 RepID=A0ABQ5K456_9EUKA|nr:Cyst wall protein type 2 [Aduncisulcus paluster]
MRFIFLALAFILVGLAFAYDEREALESFYNLAGGPDWTQSDGWMTDLPICGDDVTDPWFGIECTSDGHVAYLVLNNNNLSGKITSEIYKLEFLRSLYLNDNFLTDTIPEAICDLSNLMYLQLTHNYFIGSIPECTCGMDQLKYFYVNNNGLTGNIPLCEEYENPFERVIEFHGHCNWFSGEVSTVFVDNEYFEELYTYCNFFDPECDPAYMYLGPEYRCTASDSVCDDPTCRRPPIGCPMHLITMECGLYYPETPFFPELPPYEMGCSFPME